jgi:hypothetical protein
MNKKILAPTIVLALISIMLVLPVQGRISMPFAGHAEHVEVFVGERYLDGVILYEREDYSEGNFSNSLGTGTFQMYSELTINIITGAGISVYYALYTVNSGPYGPGTYGVSGYGRIYYTGTDVFYTHPGAVLSLAVEGQFSGGTGPFKHLNGWISITGTSASGIAVTDQKGTYWFS